jgi:hypothetical protein
MKSWLPQWNAMKMKGPCGESQEAYGGNNN